ncbi:MAG: aminoglycoside phosphotransferase family protein [Thermogemmatispora sp.]|uniref:phosphotransferase enzyme family protein n=1 Tax=Thermogemmatispora sp. TaxID=1968838 RepID=UPI0019EA521B|nr:aminoglycoside phosphotransferase family protein [Thermogemmatispora sp.]MBE3567876.1 aminoglycoside phosphotransferase family protein [Thermogemmatispora sp.]
MKENYYELEDIARSVVRKYWNIEEHLETVDTGVNKRTWRAGPYWLSCTYDYEVEAVSRELQLYSCLSERGQLPGAVAVPSVIKAQGELFVQAHGRVWWLTAHVPGRQPEPTRIEDTLAVARGLAGLHCWLAPLSPELAVSKESALTLFARGRLLALEEQCLGFTEADKEVLLQASRLIDEYLATHSQTAMQLIHGDPSHPNLRLSERYPPRLIGALDWASCRYDAPLADLATVGQTIVFRSRSRDPLADLTAMMAAYQQGGGVGFSLDALLVFMILGKFESIAHHGTRFLRGEIAADLVLSQSTKIHTILLLIQESQKRDCSS